jgi:alpha-soluble NSF attachment protein
MLVACNEMKADIVLAQADLIPINASTRDKIIVLYNEALSLYTLAEKWEKAGHVHTKLAQVHISIDGDCHYAARAFHQAGKVYKDCNTTLAIEVFTKAGKIYANLGQLQLGATVEQSIGEVYEADGRLDYAILHFQRASSMFQAEGSPAHRHTCDVKLAHLNASAAKYEEAASLFEKVALHAAKDKLLQFGATKHLLKAGVCRIATQDLMAVRLAVLTYKTISFKWPSSIESEHFNALMEACEAQDQAKFEMLASVYEKEDAWWVSALLAAKKAVFHQHTATSSS